MTAKNGTKQGSKTADVNDSKSGSSVELSNVMIGEKVEETTKEQVLQIEAPKTPTIDERIEKIQKMYSLNEKRDKLIVTKNNLSNFRISADSTNVQLLLDDRAGSSFKTTTPEVITTVLNMIKTMVNEQIEKVENEMIF